jgi:hypothetical protein
MTVAGATESEPDSGYLRLEDRAGSALAFFKLASIRLMLRKLCNPC